MNNSIIKNILFDLGGVILQLDKERCMNSFSELGIKLTQQDLGVYGQKGLLGDLELGNISESEFYNKFRLQHNTSATDNQIKSAWNSYLAGIPDDRLARLIEWHYKFDLYLLSNTSIIHHHHWKNFFKYNSQFNTLEHYFKGVFCSYSAHTVKPHEQAFKNVINKALIKPSETLFLDDSLANIEVAKAMGFKTQWIANENDIMKVDIDKTI